MRGTFYAARLALAPVAACLTAVLLLAMTQPGSAAVSPPVPSWLAHRTHAVSRAVLRDIRDPGPCVMVAGDTSVIVCRDGKLFTS